MDPVKKHFLMLINYSLNCTYILKINEKLKKKRFLLTLAFCVDRYPSAPRVENTAQTNSTTNM